MDAGDMENRSKLNEELEAIYQQVLKMGSFVEESLQKAITSLINQDRDLARRVIEDDAHIDAYQEQIEVACTKIIALEQPVAGDLRTLVTVIKIVSNLERIGDHARHLARSLSTVDRSTMDYLLHDIEQMTKRGIEMLHQFLTAFSQSDAALAESVAKMDLELDKQHRLLYDKIIGMMKNDPALVEQGSSLLIINRFLERLGDHVIAMCEWIIYADTGSHRELRSEDA